MKFGKRLAAEAARCWPEACLDYKAIKRALKLDLSSKDPAAAGFLSQLLSELTKVSGFYVEQAQMLEGVMAQQMSCSSPDAQQLSQLRAQIRQLIKFVALNYLAVVKAIKKRNRHCKAVFGEAAAGPDMHPMDLLRQEVFFTSPRLAALSTQAELLAASALASSTDTAAATATTTLAAAAGAPENLKAAAAAAAASAVVDDYQCPICLDVLRSPVVLNCTHRFCWGCLVGHCVAVTQGPSSHRAEQLASSSPAPAAPAAASAATNSSSSSPPCGGQECSGGAAHSSSVGSKGLIALEKLVAAGSNSTAGDSTSSSSSSTGSASDFYNCPVCRQPQVLSIDNLQVDPHLSVFVDSLRASMKQPQSSSSSGRAGNNTASVPSSEQSAPSIASSVSTDTDVAASLSRCSSVASELCRPAAVEEREQLQEQEEEEDWSQYLLPRQLPCHAGRLTVLLDLDGTLVSSFTPRRAPVLPASMKTHLVGVGSSLNPSGVFVVERPGLTQFLQQLAAMSEVVVFTAGLEEYASPIIDAIDPSGRLISGRLYRPACTRTQYHSCTKDLFALGRPLSRTILVDDTPLAFLHNPENGVPVLGFRGDCDDRLLIEAVLPLVQTVAGAPDVRPVLQARFAMRQWFSRHGYPDSLWQQQHTVRKAATTAARAAGAAAPHPSSPEAVRAGAAAAADLQVLIEDVVDAAQTPLLVFDFDKTISAWDAGERIVSELAPELLPWLQGLESPANFIPVTNEVLAEVARRGVSRDRLVGQLQQLGAELPAPMVQLLLWAKQQQLPVKVLSDCNSVFIGNILAGARLGGCVDEVITNAAGFERLQGSGADAAVGLGSGSNSSSSSRPGSSSSFKLVIQPRQPQSHNCPRCPSNLCKGAEMAQLLQQQRKASATAAAAAGGGGGDKPAAAASSRGRVVYAGDGANDICPALALGPDDVVLAKAGHALAAYAERQRTDSSLQQLAARVYVWDTHEQLAQLVRQHAAGPDGKCAA